MLSLDKLKSNFNTLFIEKIRNLIRNNNYYYKLIDNEEIIKNNQQIKLIKATIKLENDVKIFNQDQLLSS